MRVEVFFLGGRGFHLEGAEATQEGLRWGVEGGAGDMGWDRQRQKPAPGAAGRPFCPADTNAAGVWEGGSGSYAATPSQQLVEGSRRRDITAGEGLPGGYLCCTVWGFSSEQGLPHTAACAAVPWRKGQCTATQSDTSQRHLTCTNHLLLTLLLLLSSYPPGRKKLQSVPSGGAVAAAPAAGGAAAGGAAPAAAAKKEEPSEEDEVGWCEGGGVV